MTHFIFGLLLCLLNFTPSFAAQDKLQIVVSFSILKDVVENIAADKANVVSIVGPNQDTHVFEPTPETSKLLLNADLIIINGFAFEKWVERLTKAAGYKGPIVIASQGIDPLMLKNSKRLMPDPHVWNAVDNVKVWVSNIEKVLSTIDPKNARLYRKNARNYLINLSLLDAWINDQLKDVAQNRRKIVTAHDAFGYYAQAYGITFLSPMGLTTETEPSAFAIAELIKQIRREQISMLFVENMTNARLIKQISKETGVKIGGTLYSDALSTPGQSGDTYINMMMHNTQLFKSAMTRD